jgi:drug/metabolite transporter superfamily protein YnfA
MRFLKAFGEFWYDFIIGDDWKIAAAVVLAVAVLVAALKADVFGDHGLAILGGVLVVVAFAVSLAVDARPWRQRHSSQR